MNKHFWPGLQGPGHRLVQQQRSDYPSMTAVCRALGDECQAPGFVEGAKGRFTDSGGSYGRWGSGGAGHCPSPGPGAGVRYRGVRPIHDRGIRGTTVGISFLELGR